MFSLSTLYFNSLTYHANKTLRMLFSVEQEFVVGGGGKGGWEEIRVPLKMPAWEAMTQTAQKKKSEYS